MSTDYKFYIQRQINGEWEEAVSIEEYFNGMKYCKCVGLSTKGKPKNVYTESYPETDELRVFLPETVVRENTDLEFEFVFIGKTRRDIYDNFVSWISGHRLKYWDTCRNREVEMILLESIEPDEDELHGSEPYIKATFKFKNLKGQTTKKE